MKKLFSLVLVAMYMAPSFVHGQAKADAIIAGKNIAVVETGTGKVSGYVHNGIYTYKGIPYAQSDRFMPPVKPAPWKDVRSSLSYGPVCPTDVTTNVVDEFEFPFHHDLGYSNEHCQTVNVWTKGINDSKKRPVMVWLHGGGFAAGSAIELPSYDGENLSKKGDVVVVSINHRLNVLGFLDLSAYGEKYKSAANAGMLDIVAALQWVKENIAQFGGDPNNVTVFGQSGGGGKVSTLMAAPSAKGLFHKAIVQSGSYVTAFTESDVAKRISAAILDELGLQASQIDSLQKISYEQLNAAGKKALRKVQDQLKTEGKAVGGFGLSWGPIHDGSFLPYQITDDAATDLSKNIPLLVGTTKNEFTPFMPGNRDLTMEKVNTDLQKKYGDKATAYMAAVKKAYPGEIQPAGYVDMDLNFRAGAIKQADQKSKTGTAPVYMYLFTWQSPVNDGIYKAMHCMELAFVFDNIGRCEEMTGGGKQAYTLADKMSHAWINFAKTGDPNVKGLLPAWDKYSADGGATMIFDNQCVVRNHPDKELLTIANGTK